MSDDELDYELLEFLRASLVTRAGKTSSPSDTRVLKDAEYIYDNSIDVAIDSASTKVAADFILNSMRTQDFSTKTWASHKLHPQTKDESAVRFIFTMDLLNFSFWPEGPASEGYSVEYQGESWTGYWSLVALLQRALEEGIPITDPHFWINEDECDDELLKHVFRSSTHTLIPLFEERVNCLRVAGRTLYEKYQCSFLTCIQSCNGSAVALVNLLVNNFEVFRDEAKFQGKPVRFYKRAQILVADLWACFEGQSYGCFRDIDLITMFAEFPKCFIVLAVSDIVHL